MRTHSFILVTVLLTCSLMLAEETTNQNVVIEISKPMKGGRGLGTKGYPSTAKEETFLKKVTEKSIDLWSHIKMPKPSNITDEEWEKMQEQEGEAKSKLIPMDKYHLSDQVGEYVGWFGIVRKISWDKATDITSLIIEHKYFDGLTDLHIQIVSIYGAGDFSVNIPGKIDNIAILSLVRVYGKASKKDDESPIVTPEYIRVWDWGLFSFMDYGKDMTNPEWLKLRKVKGEDAYSPRPTKRFYEERLGKRESSNKPDAGDGK